ncbi:MAG: FliM/FliN family flagellar motor switch protein [Burkholderiaceae bacterium]
MIRSAGQTFHTLFEVILVAVAIDQVRPYAAPRFTDRNLHMSHLRAMFSCKHDEADGRTLQLKDGALHAAITIMALSRAQPIHLSVCAGAHRLGLTLPIDERWNELASITFGALPEALQIAIASMQTRSVVAVLQELLDVQLKIESVRPEPADCKDADQIVLALRYRSVNSAAEWHAWLSLGDEGAAAWTVHQLDRHRPESRGIPAWLRRLPLPLAAVPAWVPLSAKTLRSLRCGDTLLLVSAPGKARSAILSSFVALNGRSIGQALISDQQLTLQGLISKNMEEVMNESAPARSQLGDPIAALPLHAYVALPIANASIADLVGWSPGKVVQLTHSVHSEQVELRVHGQLVARGRLVALDQQLGFEITEMAAPDFAEPSS